MKWRFKLHPNQMPLIAKMKQNRQRLTPLMQLMGILRQSQRMHQKASPQRKTLQWKLLLWLKMNSSMASSIRRTAMEQSPFQGMRDLILQS